MIITSGVPQGSILGPLFLLQYINDIQNCSKIISIILFADDTNIFYSNSCLKTLNNIFQLKIDKIADWLNVNELSINTTKTKFIFYLDLQKKSISISII